MSEIGNAGWKPYNTLRLVHVAKQDTATMIMQEKDIYLFNRNKAKSTGRGHSIAVRNSRDCQEQVKIAEDFANILDDEEALRQEAEEAENPNGPIARGNAKHRPPKKNLTNDVQGNSHKETVAPKKNAPKQKTTASRKKKTADVDDDSYTENLALAA